MDLCSKILELITIREWDLVFFFDFNTSEIFYNEYMWSL